jgi:hypothetical protein
MTNTTGELHDAIRPLEDHEVDIVQGGSFTALSRVSIPVEPVRVFIPQEPIRTLFW